MATYPKPDFRFFFKTLAGMAVFLAVLHWAPDLSVWVHERIYGATIVIDMRRFRMILVVAYVMVGVAVAVHLAGLLWAIWRNRS